MHQDINIYYYNHMAYCRGIQVCSVLLLIHSHCICYLFGLFLSIHKWSHVKEKPGVGICGVHQSLISAPVYISLQLWSSNWITLPLLQTEQWITFHIASAMELQNWKSGSYISPSISLPTNHGTLICANFSVKSNNYICNIVLFPHATGTVNGTHEKQLVWTIQW
jgi:hypothetical protein